MSTVQCSDAHGEGHVEQLLILLQGELFDGDLAHAHPAGRDLRH
jgi:hypothetical protein